MACSCCVNIKQFNKSQNYNQLKRECASNKVLFQDDQFPADHTSLQLKDGTRTNVQWKRPSELCPNPKLVVGKLNSSNISQGSLGNCWFVAACCALAKVDCLWNRVVPDAKEQDWGPTGSVGHYGIFHFRLWLFGQWTDVIIDDRLPTVNGELLFAHSQLDNEFWCALLEKAYAKIFGSYVALESGNLVDALVDFTAGFAERLNLTVDNVRNREMDRLELFAHLKQSMKNEALMCCAIKALTPDEMERRTDRGLIKGHAYSITGVRSVNIARTGLLTFFQNRQRLNMIRLRNPWGEKEWNGPFSDSAWCYSTDQLQRLYASSVEWSKVSLADRNKIGLTYQDDGEFWMTFEDFCTHFTDLSICNLVNTSMCSVSKTWYEFSHFGRWSDGPRLSRTDRSGGCSNHLETFLRNPQYLFKVTEENVRLLVMLQQEDIRGATGYRFARQLNKYLSIGFEILKVEVNRKYRMHRMQKIISRSDYGETRNIFHECRLERGVYVLLPTTFTPRHNGNYLLRIFAKQNIQMRDLKLEMPKPMRFLCVSKEYQLAVAIRVKDGKEIRVPGSTKVGNPYFILTCGARKIRGAAIKNTTSPHWDTEVIFYLTETKITAKIQVWSSECLKDRLIGEADLQLQEAKPPKTVAWSITLVSPVTATAPTSNRTVATTTHVPVIAGKVVLELFVTSNLAAI